MKRGKGEETAGKPVGIWIRVSTEDQAKGESPEHHERRARYYAESKGWKVVEVYHLEGVSGKSVMEHPEAKRMLADIKKGHITALIFSKLARLARNTRQLLDFADLFRDAGADLVSLQESIDTSTPAGRLFYTMIAAMAQWEREEIAERVAVSVTVRAKMGKPLGGQAPFGYAWVNRALVPNPDEVPVYRRMCELFAEYKRKRTVARLLNEAGFRTRNGSLWSDTSVVRLLQDPTAKGKHRLNYTKTRGDRKAWKLKPESEWEYVEVEPIVPADLWEECNGIIDGYRAAHKRPARRAVQVFAGLTYCECGGKMYVPANTPKYVCYKCRNKIPIEDLEAVYVSELKGVFLSKTRLETELKRSNESIGEKEELLKSRVAERDRVQREIDKAYRLYLDGKLDGDRFTDLYNPLYDQKKALDEETPRLQAELDVLKVNSVSADEVLSEASDLYTRWPKFERELKRRVVESITDKIVVGKDEVAIQLAHIPSSREELTKKQRDLIRSLPSCGLELRCSKPRSSALPVDLKSLGDHIRKRRLELGLLQKTIGQRIGVHCGTIWDWENSYAEPELRHIPAIIAFLGYDPRAAPKSLPERLVWYREGRGWSQKRFAEVLGVDQSTLAKWERGQREPKGEYSVQISQMLQPSV